MQKMALLVISGNVIDFLNLQRADDLDAYHIIKMIEMIEI